MTPFRPATLVAALAMAFATHSALAADAAASVAAPAAPVASAPAALGSGLDKASMDTSVRPQDDLYLAMNGQWIKTTEIPADKREYGTFIQLRDLSDERVKAIIDKLAGSAQPAGSTNAKIADYFRSYMDTAAIDQAGLAPMKPWLDQVDALKTKKDLAALLGRWQGVMSLPLDLNAMVDFKDPHIYSPVASQGGLGLPNRDYYLKDTERFAKARTAYVTYLTTLFTLQGDAAPDAQAHATAVMALEKKIAQIQWDNVANRDPVKTYNPTAFKALAGKAPGFDWTAFLAAGDMPAPKFVSLMQPSYDAAMTKLFAATPVATWQLYLRARALDTFASVLPQGFRDARYAFRDVALGGVKAPEERWKRAVTSLNGAMGEAVGQAYVAEYFPPAYKARMLELVHNLLATYRTSIDGLAWMTPATKKAAQEKLAKYGVKIGYPDKWRDYSALEVKAGDPVGNAARAARFEYDRQAVRLFGPVDRLEWGMTPQTVNAYYDPTMNEIVFPAAILQPPFFDMKADDAANYGAIGAVIGHEISHGFDDEGSQFDGDGKLRNWWTPADRKAFDAITAKLVAQYDAYEPIKGSHVNGKLTLGENIADLSGVQIAYKAYKLSLQGQPAPVIDGLTGDQRFYLGWAQAWRERVREERALQLVTIDPHSPPQFRADGAAINADGFHEAFGTKPGDAMWKAPADRIRLW